MSTAVIWKYPLDRLEMRLRVPAGAVLLTVQVQRGVPTVWARVNPDPNAPQEERAVVLVPTGGGNGMIHPEWRYLGTIQLHDGEFVAHAFEVPL